MRDFLALDGCEDVDNLLFAFTARAKEWAKEKRLDLSIRPLSAAMLGMKTRNSIAYPELTSRIKASRTRNLLAFVTHFAIELERALPLDADPGFAHWNQMRASMLWSLDSALSLFGRGQRPWLSAAEAREGADLLQLHLDLYQQMARISLRKRVLGYKIRPKCHYICHLIYAIQEDGLNPMHVANFAEEDYMKFMRNCVHGCHPRAILTAWTSRYILRRALMWRDLQARRR